MLLRSIQPKKAQVATRLLTSCNNLLQQADIRMRSHGLRQLIDDKSVASCQQTCCKLTVKACYPQACCKLFQQVVTSLQMTNCNKPDINRLRACSYGQKLSRLPRKHFDRSHNFVLFIWGNVFPLAG